MVSEAVKFRALEYDRLVKTQLRRHLGNIKPCQDWVGVFFWGGVGFFCFFILFVCLGGRGVGGKKNGIHQNIFRSATCHSSWQVVGLLVGEGEEGPATLGQHSPWVWESGAGPDYNFFR